MNRGGKWGLKKNLVPRHPCLSCKLSRPTCTFFSGGWWTLLVKLWKCFNHQSQNRKLYFQTQQFANSRGQLAHCKSEVDELKLSHVASKCQMFVDISNILNISDINIMPLSSLNFQGYWTQTVSRVLPMLNILDIQII